MVIKFTDPSKLKPAQPVAPKEVSAEPKSATFIPIDDLPSKYRLYSESTKIFAKPMTTKNVKSLANVNDTNYNTIFTEVIAENVKGIDVNEIVRSDKFYLIFWLRANTYKDSGYEVQFNCPHCKKNTTYNFTVNALEIDYIKDDIDLNIVLPDSKTKLKIKYVTIADETRFIDFKRITAKNIRDFDEDNLSFAIEIEQINDEALSLLKRYEFVSGMSPIDYAYLESFLDHIAFGVRENIIAQCNSCKGVTPIGVNFRKEFFIPKFEFGKN